MNRPRPLLCADVVEGQPPSHPAVVRTVCRPCGAKLWVTIVMLPHVNSGRAEPTCERCARRLLDKSNARVTLPRETIAELRAMGLLDAAQTTVRNLNQAARDRRRAKKKARGRNKK